MDESGRIGVGVVMPAYCAERTVAATIGRVPVDALRGAGYAPVLYVVDDGSPDATAAAVEPLLDAGPCPVRLLRHDRNRGYGAAQKTGLSRSLEDGHALHAILHADGQYDPAELPELLAPLRAGRADVAIGSKFARGGVLRQGMPLSRMLGIRTLDWLENRLFGLRGLEFHSGSMAYTTAALRSIPLGELTDGFHFDGEMVLTTARRGLRAELVPIATTYGGDTSSLAPGPYLVEVARVVARRLRG